MYFNSLNWKIFKFEKVTSTMDVAKDIAEKIDHPIFVVTARVQSRGKGRKGRFWYSPEGGLWVTIVLRGVIPNTKIFMIPYLVAVATAETINHYSCGKSVSIKWPNDILIEGKKVAGILIDSRESCRSDFQDVFIGIGININNPVGNRKDLRDTAISLSEVCKKEYNISEILDFLLKKINILLIEFIRKRSKPDKLFDLWKKFDITLGRKISVDMEGKKIIGRAVDIDYNDGGLIFDIDGNVIKIYDYVSIRILEE
ncbi:MAG: biotin--[acetyl-CoA-carboxylase] ligase [Candidatus Odinarchaeota archaeon]|nr:biotin--[acetyl-CoA-carboxylase] ligase [Candidatus Odinarchaeota archaeon]